MHRNLLLSTGFWVIFHVLKGVVHFPFCFSRGFKSYKLMGFALTWMKGNTLPYVSNLEPSQRPKTSLALSKPCPVETPCSV